MRVPLRWLADYVEVSRPAAEIARLLTESGTEVERIDEIGTDWEQIVVGRIATLERVPRANRLQVAQVDIGGREATIVTAATNVAVGQFVPTALPGAIVRHGGERIEIQPRKLSGVASEGMMCSGVELGISDEADGILVLAGEPTPGTPLRELLGDLLLDLAVTPNRPDCLSMVGIAREVGVLTGHSVRLPEVRFDETGQPTADLVSVTIEEPDLCRRYVARVITGVTVRPSPEWLASRLRAAGLPVINNVVDVSNYVMWELGQPLHTFDAAKLSGRQIVVRCARLGERIVTIDSRDRALTPQMLVIADAARPIAVAGVMGGLETEVSSATTDILIESANFAPTTIRQTRIALGLPSEASRRFERGVDREQAAFAADRAAQLIQHVAGGTIAVGRADSYPSPRAPREVVLTAQAINDLLGDVVPAILPFDRVAELFATLGLTSIAEGAASLRVRVPSFRLDINEPEDLIEEIARLVGYDVLPSALPSGAAPAGGRNAWMEYEDDVRAVLLACGLSEVVTYALTSRERMRRLLAGRAVAGTSVGSADGGDGAPHGMAGATVDGGADAVEGDAAADAAALERSLGAQAVPLPSVLPGAMAASIDGALMLRNPLSSEQSVLRISLLESMFMILAANEHRGEARQQLFEIGRVYLPRPDALPDERRTAVFALAGRRYPRHWGDTAAASVDYFDAKGVVELLLARFGVRDVRFAPAVHPTFHPGRAAYVICGDERVGVVGEAHVAVVEAFDLPPGRVCLAEIDLQALHRHACAVGVSEVQRFPAVTQDLALVVEEGVAAADVVAAIREAGAPLVVAVELFDIYRGNQIGRGRKSLAYEVTFQSEERTLTTVEVTAVRQAILDGVARKVGASLRA